MIDTIKILLQIDQLPHNYSQLLQPLLTEKKYTTSETGELLYIRAKYKNFYITINNRGLYISGSLTTYIFNSNLKTAFKDDLYDGVCKLGNELSINLFEGKVLRLDIAANIITKYAVEEYYKNLSRLKRMNRLEQPNGITYGNTDKHMSFYGKIAQLKNNREYIEPMMEKQNVLRYEHRFINHDVLSRFLKVDTVNVETVFQYYSKIISNWVNNYIAITKSNDVKQFGIDSFCIKGNFTKQLQMLGVESLGGIQTVFEMIESAKKEGAFKKYPNVVTNIRTKLRCIMDTPSLVEVRKTNTELLQKIQMLSVYAKQ